MNRIFELRGESSVLELRLTVPIHHKFKKVGLVGFYSTFLTPNVTIKNNKLHYEKNVHGLSGINTMVIPSGQYTLEDLEKTMSSLVPSIRIEQNKQLHRIEITSDYKLYFDKDNSIGSLLGFNDQIVEPKIKTLARDLPKIIPFEMIKVHLNLADGLIVKNTEHFHSETNIIAAFKPKAEFRGPIVYEPKYPLFFPVHDKIQNFKVIVTDESDRLIDFNNSSVTVILEII